MKTVGIIGGGTMGSGIALLVAQSGYDAIVQDISTEQIEKARQRISSSVQKSVEKSELDAVQAEAAISRIRFTTTLQDFSSADFIIEAAIENLAIKQDIFQKLDEACAPQVVLATNTSSIPVTAIASSTKHPARVVGMHFFNPPRRMKLVEVVRGFHSSQEAVAQTMELAKQLGKKTIVTKDTPGFIVNRIARPFYGEALRLLGEGVASAEDIDTIVKLEGGFKMGPFELIDLIGVDVNLAVTTSMFEQTFGEPRYRPHVIQQTMVAAGLLGKKTKRGFYRYE